jgi:hypothetical protein
MTQQKPFLLLKIDRIQIVDYKKLEINKVLYPKCVKKTHANSTVGATGKIPIHVVNMNF